jgi:hypothetical protein
MLWPPESGASDSAWSNSPLIDFNGEILISLWPRSPIEDHLFWVMQDNPCIRHNLSLWQGAPDIIHDRGLSRELQYMAESSCRELRLQLDNVNTKMCLLSGNAQQISADVKAASRECLEQGMRISVRGSIFYLNVWGCSRLQQVMCCVTTQWLYGSLHPQR